MTTQRTLRDQRSRRVYVETNDSGDEVASSDVVTVSSGTPEAGQFPQFTGDGSDVVPVAPPGGSAWNIVSPTEDYTATAGDFVSITQGILVTDCTVTAESPTLTTTNPVFTDSLVGRFLDDFWFGDGHVRLGTRVLSVESATSLTMSDDAAADDAADEFQFGITITLPAPDLNARVGVEFYGGGGVGVAGTFAFGSGMSFPPGQGNSPGAPAAAVFVADGTNWQVESFSDAPPTPLFVNNYPATPPLPTGAVLGAPAIWSVTANGGNGGFVQDAIVGLLVEYHSSSDSGDILALPPFQQLFAAWSKTVGGLPQSSDFFGYVDHVPAGGHAGLQLTYQAPIQPGAQDFHVGFNDAGYFGVIRLDGTASCVVSPVTAATIPNTLSGGSYNADSTLMDWAGASIKGTDLTADATNNWIHSTAGGLVYIFSNLAIAPIEDDFPVFS